MKSGRMRAAQYSGLTDTKTVRGGMMRYITFGGFERRCYNTVAFNSGHVIVRIDREEKERESGSKATK